MLYKFFSSLKTSVYILAAMSIMFLIGTIFPQGENIEDYIEAGGKYVPLVRALDFLDIFMSPLFLVITFVLTVNLIICLYDRFKIFIKIKRRVIDFERLKGHPNVLSFDKAAFEKRLKTIGFTFKIQTDDAVNPGIKVYEKGIQYWWLSWFYHVGIILAILGFFVTALFAFEKGVLLFPGKPESISLYSKETRWNEFLEKMGMDIPEEQVRDEYVLTLEEFVTEYNQVLKIDYPKGKLERLAIGIGMTKLVPSPKGFSYMPKMWLTRFNVKKPDGEVLYAKLWVNRPFRTGYLTLYQMGYEQRVELLANGKVIDAEARVPFEVEGVNGKFVLGSLKVGTLFKKDGTTEKIDPVTTLYHIPEDDPKARNVLGEITLGDKIDAKDTAFEFRDYKEGSYLSYRKDPGIWLVGLAGLFVFLGLFVRSLGAWYRIQYAVESKTAYVLISSRGILADKDRIIKKLKKK
ncbi:MAG: cytochrome c biogenesis protein ResB [Nitrospirota bacterium]